MFDVNQPDDVTLDRWIERVATRTESADRHAFVAPAGEWSYRRLNQRVETVAARLAEAGIRVGDRVGYCGLNRVELFEVLFGCARLGAIMVPFNNRLTATELAVQIADSEPKVLLATDGFDAVLAAATGGQHVRNLDVDPFVEGAGAAPRSGAVEHPLLMVYTSGTTGRAKGAVLTQRSIAYTVANGVDHQQLTADDRILAVTPTFHVGGLNIQVLPAIAVGATIILPVRFDPTTTLDAIASYRPTQTVFVPAVLDAVANHPRFAEVDLGCFTGINSGSSVVPAAAMAPYFARGVPIGQVYGATESGPTAVVLDYADGEAHQGTAGRPARHTELRIVTTDARLIDPDDRPDGARGATNGRDAEVGVAGEIWLRGPNLFDHYWRQPEATAEAFVDGWYRTGDVGHIDEQGFLCVHDRVRDMFVSGGENVYPAEVEAVLGGYPGIAELTVVARPDDRWGEVGVAVIVAGREPAPTIEQLRAWGDEMLARFKLPREVRVVESLPRTALGKVQKHLVRTELGLAGAGARPTLERTIDTEQRTIHTERGTE